MEQPAQSDENASDNLDCRIVHVWTLKEGETQEAMDIDGTETQEDYTPAAVESPNTLNSEDDVASLATQLYSKAGATEQLEQQQQDNPEGGDDTDGIAIEDEVYIGEEATAEKATSETVLSIEATSPVVVAAAGSQQEQVDVEEVSQDSEAGSNTTPQEPVVLQVEGGVEVQQDVTTDKPSTSAQPMQVEERIHEADPSTPNMEASTSEAAPSQQDVNQSTVADAAGDEPTGLLSNTDEVQDEPPGTSSPDHNTTDDDMTLDLVTCHICLSEINNPKSLPCLHTFCRSCLAKWANERPNTLRCPTCQEDYSLPPEGIEGLKGNFFVSKLKDRRALKRKLSSPEKIVCSACNNGGEATSRCVDCNDFLCSRCTEMHATIRVLKSHQVVNVNELRSGKVNLFKHPKQQQEQCRKHSGQIVWFYCETCSVLICRDCTVVDHCRPEHHYVNVQDAIRGQRQNIQSMTEDCKKILVDVEAEMEKLHGHEGRLDRVVKEASAAVNSAADRAVADLQVCIEAKRADHHARIQGVFSERKVGIDAHREKLVSLTSRLKTALDMGQQVIENGSEFEVASTFHSLLATLQQLKRTKLPVIRKEMSKLAFETNEGPLFTIHELGFINTYSTWKVTSKFGRGNDGAKPITKAWAVCIATNGIAVANNSSSGNVSVHDRHPPHEILSILETSKGLGRNPSGWKSFPRGVAATQNNHFYVTDNTMFVKEYSGSGRYLTQFAAVHPNGQTSDTMKITLDSVAVDRHDNILIGPNQHKFISMHKPNGAHVRSFPVTIEPHFIATSRHDDKLVLSSHISNTVHVVDGLGNTQHILSISNIPVWRPRGMCCTGTGEVFVSNAVKDKVPNGAPGIYRFSMANGQFLGAVTKDVNVPYGLALSDDEQVLVVGDKKLVTIFELR